MKCLILIVALAVLGLTSAAPQVYDYAPDTGDGWKILNDLQAVQAVDNKNINSLFHEKANSQFVQALLPMLAPVAKEIGTKALKSYAGCSENNENAQPLSYRGDLSKRHADLKAVIEVMKNINAATKKLSELQRNMMKDNQVVAQAEIMSWFSGALDKLKDVGGYVKELTKDIVCNM